MAKIYTTPDFDVTAFEIEDVISAEVIPGDPDDMASWKDEWELV